MIIDIDRLPSEGLKVCRDFEFFNVELVEENSAFCEPVHAEISVRKVGEEVFIKGKVRTCLSFVCSRCLLPFEFPIDSSFDLVSFPEELDAGKYQLDSDDLNKYFYYTRKIDLKEIVLEQLNLTFPVKPLCSEDCQGICPICGKIVKNGECSCMANESDSRLKKLKFFLRDKR